MEVGIYAPSTPALVVSLALAMLGLICFFVMAPDNLDIGFWIAMMAYVTLAVSTTVKT